MSEETEQKPVKVKKAVITIAEKENGGGFEISTVFEPQPQEGEPMEGGAVDIAEIIHGLLQRMMSEPCSGQDLAKEDDASRSSSIGIVL